MTRCTAEETSWSGLPPNRIAGGRFRFGGREYQLEVNDAAGGNHIHGFPLRRPWRVESLGAGTVTIGFHAADYPDVLAQFSTALRARSAPSLIPA